MRSKAFCPGSNSPPIHGRRSYCLATHISGDSGYQLVDRREGKQSFKGDPCVVRQDDANVVTVGKCLYQIEDLGDSIQQRAVCAAVGYDDSGGNVFSYNGGTWSAPESLDAGYKLHSISCATTTFCEVGAAVNVFTVDGTSESGPDAIDQSNNETNESGYGLSMSCPSATFCATIDGSGNAFILNGSTWSAPDSIDKNVQLDSVSCVSAGFCVAVDSEGNAFTYLQRVGLDRGAVHRLEHRAEIGVVPLDQLLRGGRRQRRLTHLQRYGLVGPKLHRLGTAAGRGVVSDHQLLHGRRHRRQLRGRTLTEHLGARRDQFQAPTCSNRGR